MEADTQDELMQNTGPALPQQEIVSQADMQRAEAMSSAEGRAGMASGQQAARTPINPPAWEEVSGTFRQAFPDLEPAYLERRYNQALDLRKERLKDDEEGDSYLQRFGRQLAQRMPFAQHVFPIADQVHYNQAMERYNHGDGTPEDHHTIAAYERHQREDAQATSTPAGASGEALLRMPAVAAEWMSVANILGMAGMGAPSLFSGATAGGMAGNAIVGAGRLAATTAVNPAMYVGAWHENNQRAGRDPLDPRGLPAAFGLGLMNTAVLGTLGRLFPNMGEGAGLAGLLGRNAARVGAGMLEMEAANNVGGLLGWQTRYGTLAELIGGGDEATKHLATDIITLGAFSLLHESSRETRSESRAIDFGPRESGLEATPEGPGPSGPRLPQMTPEEVRNNPVIQAFQEAFDTYRKSGQSLEKAVRGMSAIVGDYKAAVAANPNITRAELRRLFERPGQDRLERSLRNIGLAIADAHPEQPTSTTAPQPAAQQPPQRPLSPQVDNTPPFGDTVAQPPFQVRPEAPQTASVAPQAQTPAQPPPNAATRPTERPLAPDRQADIWKELHQNGRFPADEIGTRLNLIHDRARQMGYPNSHDTLERAMFVDAAARQDPTMGGTTSYHPAIFDKTFPSQVPAKQLITAALERMADLPAEVRDQIRRNFDKIHAQDKQTGYDYAALMHETGGNLGYWNEPGFQKAVNDAIREFAGRAGISPASLRHSIERCLPKSSEVSEVSTENQRSIGNQGAAAPQGAAEVRGPVPEAGRELGASTTTGRGEARGDQLTQDFFGVKPEQRNLYQEGVVRPGWIQPAPEAKAEPLYKPDNGERAIPSNVVNAAREAMASGNGWRVGKILEVMNDHFSAEQNLAMIEGLKKELGMTGKVGEGSPPSNVRGHHRWAQADLAKYEVEQFIRQELEHEQRQGLDRAEEEAVRSGEEIGVSEGRASVETGKNAGLLGNENAPPQIGPQEQRGDAHEGSGAVPGDFNPGEWGGPTTRAVNDFLRDESGHLDPERIQEWVIGKVAQIKKAGEYIANNYRELAGHMFPRLTKINQASGEALARFVSSRNYARVAAPVFIDKVMGPNKTMADRMLAGAVLTERRLRFMKQAYIRAGDPTAASKVNSIIGKEGSPLKTIQDYQRALADPIMDGIMRRWNNEFVPVMEDNFRRAQGMEDDDPINSFTQIQGSPVNLKPYRQGEDPTASIIPTGQGGRGNLKNVKMGKFIFAQQATGLAHGYDIDLGAMIENSLARGFGTAAKAEWARTMVENGAARWGVPGAQVEGAREVPWVNPPKGTQENTRRQTSLYVDEAAYKEVRQALQVDDPLHLPGITNVAPALNFMTLASTVEAAYHSKNMLTFLMKPGIRPQDFVRNIFGVWNKNSWVGERIMELARVGAHKEHYENAGYLGGGKWDPTRWMSRALDFTREVMELTANDAFNRLAKSGLVKNTETNRRNFINQLGQYNKAADNKLSLALRDSGIGPFAKAGTNYFIQKLKGLTMHSGAEATSRGAGLRMRAEMLAKTFALIGLTIPILNKLMWDRWDGDDDTPFASLKIGRDKNGRTSSIGFGNLIGFVGGLRETGLLALIEGTRRGTAPGTVIDRGVENIVGSALHPFEGPLPQFVHTAITGNNALGMKLADKVPPGESHAIPNLLSAFRQANPVVAALSGAGNPGNRGEPVPLGERVNQLAGPYGLQYRGGFVNDVQRRFNELSGPRTTATRQGRFFENEHEYQIISHAHQQIIQLDQALRGEHRSGARLRGGDIPSGANREWLLERQRDIAKTALEAVKAK